MKTLEITARKPDQFRHVSVTICETDDTGFRDGFESVEIPVDETLPPVLKSAAIDRYLSGLAQLRGLAYPENPLMTSALNICESLVHHGFREPQVTNHGPGIGVTVSLSDASVLLKPVIRGIALQFTRPGFQWEMRVSDADRTASAVAGLVLLARMPA